MKKSTPHWSLMLFLIFSFSTLRAAEFYQPEDVVKDFTILTNWINTQTKSNGGCSSVIGDRNFKKGGIFYRKECGIKQLCAPFNENKDQDLFYQSDDGSKIVNPFVENLNSLISNCESIKLNENFSSEEFLASEEYKQLDYEYNNQVYAKESQFNQLLEKHGATKAFNDLTNESFIQNILEDEINNGKDYNSPNLQIALNTALSEGIEYDINGNEIIKKGISPESAAEISLEYDKLIEFKKAKKSVIKNKLYSKYKRVDATDDFFKNPSLFLAQPTTSPEEKEKAKIEYSKKLEVSKRIFNETKSQVLILLEKKKNADNSRSVDAMMERVKSVEITPVLEYELSSGCSSINAFYSPYRHAISLCPQFMVYPEVAIKEVFAHEIGHSFDPCLMTGEFSSKEDGSHKVSYPDRDGVMGSTSSKPISEPVLPDENPFKDQIKCMQGKDSLNARVPSHSESFSRLQDGIKFINKKISELTKEKSKIPDNNLSQQINVQATISELQAERKILENDIEKHSKMYDRYQMCAFMPGKPQMGEAFADWIAAETVAMDIEKADPSSQRKLAFEGLAFSIRKECMKDLDSPVYKGGFDFLVSKGCIEKDKKLFKNFLLGKRTKVENGKVVPDKKLDLGQQIDRAVNDRLDEHSKSIDRAEKMFTAHPIIQESLGCKSKGDYCE